MLQKETKKDLINLIRNDKNSYCFITDKTALPQYSYSYENAVGNILEVIRERISPSLDKAKMLICSEDIFLINTLLLYGMLTDTTIFILPKEKLKKPEYIKAIMFSNDIKILVCSKFTSPTALSSINFILIPEDVLKFKALEIKGLNKKWNFNAIDKHSTKSTSFAYDSVGVKVLSPGTTTGETLISIPYFLLYNRMKDFALEFQKDSNEKTVNILMIGDEITLFGINSLFPLFVTKERKDNFNWTYSFYSGTSLEMMKNLFNSRHDKKEIIITSDRIRKVWDNLVLETNNNKFLLYLNTKKIFKAIKEKLITISYLNKFFGKNIKRIHIINEQLGNLPLSVMRRSSIVFTSSYGALELGNFIAYKNKYLFKHKELNLIKGGVFKENASNEIQIIPKLVGDTYLTFSIKNPNKNKNIIDIIAVYDACTFMRDFSDIIMWSEAFLHKEPNDNILFIRVDNLSNGNKEFQIIINSFKDSLLVRDLIFQKGDNNELFVMIEPREELLDMQKISYESFNYLAKEIKLELEEILQRKITSVATLSFKDLRNRADKVISYLF